MLTPPIEIKSEITISPSIVNPGGDVIMSSSYCKNTDADSALSTFWQREDGLIWQLKIRQVSISKKGCSSVSIPLTIPEDIPEGRWQRVNVATYKVNLLAPRTGSGGSVDIGGSNAAPSGTFQAASACPVTAATDGKEVAYELLNDSCGVGFNKWTTVTVTA
jgi:hypothetical protein